MVPVVDAGQMWSPLHSRKNLKADERKVLAKVVPVAFLAELSVSGFV
jgi:hypothetical protein